MINSFLESDLFNTLKIIFGLVFGIALMIYVIKDAGSHSITVYKNIKKGKAGGLKDVCLQLGMKMIPPPETSDYVLSEATYRKIDYSGDAEGLFDRQLVKVSWTVGHGNGYDPSNCKTLISIALPSELTTDKINQANISIKEQRLVMEIAGINSNKEQLKQAIKQLITLSV